MSENNEKIELVKSLISSKSIAKQDCFYNLIDVFKRFEQSAILVCASLEEWISQKDPRVIVQVKTINDQEFRIQVGGETLIFLMHSNAFAFPENHTIYKHPSIKDNLLSAFFGTIEVYNYLSASIKYERYNDLGEMLVRFFFNKDNHFLAEGHGQFKFLYSELSNNPIDDDLIQRFIYDCIHQSLDFDLTVPPFAEVQHVPLGFIVGKSMNIPHTTNKKLGFKLGGNQDS
ncbi:MAG: hypothetical protein MUE53_04790 [Chitinophagales bacterium]|jgi:hypothetical protein|nr:hypothetical protein [Chitinophagales bacterium]